MSAVLSVALSATAEGFINLPHETHTIGITKGEAVVITSVMDADQDAAWPAYTLQGRMRNVGWRPGAVLIGPGEITSTTNRSIVNYARFTAPYIHWLSWSNNFDVGYVEKHQISVPAGKTLRLLGALENNSIDIWTTQPGTTNRVCLVRRDLSPIQDPTAALDLPGPIQLELTTQSCCAFRLYYFIEDAGELALEKSPDLVKWSPLLVWPLESVETNAFYRLRITK